MALSTDRVINLAPALEFALEEAFAVEAGAREGVPAILIVVASETSDDPVTAQVAIKQLLAAGIDVIFIAAGPGSMEQAGDLMLDPQNIVGHSDMATLATIGATVIQKICGFADTHTAPAPQQTIIAPFQPACTLGDLTEISQEIGVSCGTSRIFPEAMCRFYIVTDGGEAVELDVEPTYTHIPLTPDGYSAKCFMKIPLKELGDGTHRFQVQMYPNVTDGINYSGGPIDTDDFNLTLPTAFHTCGPNLKENYLCGIETVCNCTLDKPGFPRGSSHWFMGGQPLATKQIQVIDSGMPEVSYTCRGVSVIGSSFGSELKLETETTCDGN